MIRILLLAVPLLHVGICNAQHLSAFEPPLQPSAFDSTHPSPAQNDSLSFVATTKRFLFDQTQPWTAYRLIGDDLLRLPKRGTENYIPLLPGIVDLAEYRPYRAGTNSNTLHVRGSRTGEILYLLDGFSTTNPLTHSNDFPLIPEAIEDLEVHTGAYGAGWGSANGGVVASRMRTGGDSLVASLRLNADGLAKPGNEFLKSTVNGYRDIVGTISGPLGQGAHFFLAGEHMFAHNRDPIFLEPFSYNLQTDFFWAYSYQLGSRPLPGPVEIKRNYLGGNWAETNSIQGNVSFGLEPLEFRFSGAYSFEEKPIGRSWWAPYYQNDALRNIFRQKNQLNDISKSFFSLRATHVLDPSTSYSIGLSYQRTSSRTYDKDFGDEWMLYADSNAARSKGYILMDSSSGAGPGSTGWINLRYGPQPYTAIYGFSFNHEYAPLRNYSKETQASLAVSFDLQTKVMPEWELKAGMKYEHWTMRSWNIQWIDNLLSFMDYNGDYYAADSLRRYPDREKERMHLFAGSGTIDYYGYGVLGEEIQNGSSGPRTPRFLSLYFNNEYVSESMTLNLGGRYESFWSGLLVYPEDDPTFTKYTVSILRYGFRENIIDADKLKEQEASHYFLPRVNISFRWEGDGMLFLSYGEYTQLTDLKQVYHGTYQIDNALRRTSFQYDTLTRRYLPWWLGHALPGQYLQPERSTQTELGFRHALSSNGMVSVSYYQKRMKDQLQLGYVRDTAFVDFLNNGEGVSRGVDVSLELRPSQTVWLGLTYSFHDSYGTTSNLVSNAPEVTDQPARTPTTQPPFNFSVRHRGVAMISFKGKDEDAFLQGSELLLLFKVSSGHPYTLLKKIKSLGSAAPWNVGARPLLDVREAVPEEPLNSSVTPWTTTIDLRIKKDFNFTDFSLQLALEVLNLLNSRNILNVFPTTGSTTGDGWIGSDIAESYRLIPNYESFYRDINIKNGWAYAGATGNSMYGQPRQIRLGLRVSM